MVVLPIVLRFFFFNDTATTEIYTLSLHDALPICPPSRRTTRPDPVPRARHPDCRSEEHTSELQSRRDLVCRLLLEKKKPNRYTVATPRERLDRRTSRCSATPH